MLRGEGMACHINGPCFPSRSVSWEESKNLGANYANNQLVMDANQGFGRNTTVMPLKSREAREEAGQETYSDDDELRAGCNLERKTGKADPPRLTPHQRQVVEVLVKTHGDDLQVGLPPCLKAPNWLPDALMNVYYVMLSISYLP